MQKLRSLHLYLGCIFAPMLLFFAISGIWQTLGFNNHFLRMLTTVHTSHNLKGEGGLAGLSTMFFVLMMTLSFIITTILGIVMAIKYGRSRRAAFYCLAAGVIIPLSLVVARALGVGI